MNKRRLLLLSCGVLFLAIVIGLFRGWFFAPQPSRWTSIRAGMTRKEIHAIVGEPTIDAIEMEGLDRWQTKALFSERELDVFYLASQNGIAEPDIASAVVVHLYTRANGKTVDVYSDELPPPQSTATPP